MIDSIIPVPNFKILVKILKGPMTKCNYCFSPIDKDMKKYQLRAPYSEEVRLKRMHIRYKWLHKEQKQAKLMYRIRSKDTGYSWKRQ